MKATCACRSDFDHFIKASQSDFFPVIIKMNRMAFAPGIGLWIFAFHQIVGANGRSSTSRANFLPTRGISEVWQKNDQPMSRIGFRLRQYREVRASREPLRGKKLR